MLGLNGGIAEGGLGKEAAGLCVGWGVGVG